MPDQLTLTSSLNPPRVELAKYAPELPMSSLVVGVDNIHHDVYLSPKFVEASRTFLFDLIRQLVNLSHFPGFERKPMRAPEMATLRKLLAELMQSSMTRAKYDKNIERDVLLRVALLKLLTQETLARFGDLLLEAKECMRARGNYFERSEAAHVLKSRLAEIQANRRDVVRQVGQQLYQMLAELDETTAKSRKALFGDEPSDFYEMFNNRLIFVEGGRDDRLFLDHFVMTGNYQRDPDRLEVFERMLIELVREKFLPVERSTASSQNSNSAQSATESVKRLRGDLAQLDAQREDLIGRLARTEELLGRMLRRDDPAELRAALRELDKRRSFLQQKLESLTSHADSARPQSGSQPQRAGNFDEYLSQPENVRALFGSGNSDPSDVRSQLLDEWITRLEQSELLIHVLASYEVRNLHLDYCPPLHLQQLRRALVSRDELKRAEEILGQFPAKQFSIKRLEESSRKLRRYSREEIRTIALRFAEDLMRLHREMRDYQRLTAAMEKINLVRVERTRELSQINRTLYEFLLPEEERPAEDHVVTHAVIKADIRGSTRMTQLLLARGMNPASHMSLNLYEPAQRILETYGASKIFIEGDAIVLGIYETESNRTRQRAVAKACLLARQILAIAEAYNQRTATDTVDLPKLELGVGVAFQNSPPTYWMDKDYRIMISKAINLSDRLSSCSKAARRLLGDHKSPFRVFLFQTAIEGTTEEELDEFLLRYNLNGVELNEEGFQKLNEEISLSASEAVGVFPWGRERATFYSGLVPIGDKLQPLLIRKGFVRQLMPDGKIGAPGSRAYYEVCADGAAPVTANPANRPDN
jgi:hypothetical protein